jgi:hypothetical protein
MKVYQNARGADAAAPAVHAAGHLVVAVAGDDFITRLAAELGRHGDALHLAAHAQFLDAGAAVLDHGALHLGLARGCGCRLGRAGQGQAGEGEQAKSVHGCILGGVGALACLHPSRTMPA